MTDFKQRWVNLASGNLGAEAIACSDDFFAPMERMLNDADPVFIEDKFDDHGKWMDGWESRRKRGPGNDWCIVRLARPGVIHGIEIDTTHFTGNYPPGASVEGCFVDQGDPGDDTQWSEILSRTALKGDDQFASEIESNDVYSHMRVTIYPDGGIARFRVYGAPRVDWSAIPKGQLVDIASALNGGVALLANDSHYGSIRNLLAPGRGVNMGDGWETRRRREPGNDWVILALARPGRIRQVVIDTAHFKGNYPDRCDILGTNLESPGVEDIEKSSESWDLVMPQQKLAADTVHEFSEEINDGTPVSHIRVNIYPDGGLSRVRVFAEID